MALTPKQIEDLDSRSSIELVSVNLLLREPKLFHAVLLRAANFQVGTGVKLTITGNERASNGWLEFGMCVEYASGGRMFIGCIQRTTDAEPEFHS